MKALYLITSLAITLSLCSCSTTRSTVIPQGGNKYTVVTTGSDEGKTTQAAMNKALETCKTIHKVAIVMKHTTKYQGGMSKGDKEAIDTAAKIASSFSHTFVSGASSDSDYKATVVFRCK